MPARLARARSSSRATIAGSIRSSSCVFCSTTGQRSPHRRLCRSTIPASQNQRCEKRRLSAPNLAATSGIEPRTEILRLLMVQFTRRRGFTAPVSRFRRAISRAPSRAREKVPCTPRVASWISSGPSMESTMLSRPAATRSRACRASSTPFVVRVQMNPRAFARRIISAARGCSSGSPPPKERTGFMKPNEAQSRSKSSGPSSPPGASLRERMESISRPPPYRSHMWHLRLQRCVSSSVRCTGVKARPLRRNR